MRTGSSLEQVPEHTQEKPLEARTSVLEGWRQSTFELRPSDLQEDYLVRIEGSRPFATRFNPRTESHVSNPLAGLRIDLMTRDGRSYLTVGVKDGIDGRLLVRRENGSEYAADLGQEAQPDRAQQSAQQLLAELRAEVQPHA